MKNNLEEKIYSAQTIGNVEPIEYMTPYPSIRSLIEGQTIKFGEQTIIEEPNITNGELYNLINKTSNWLRRHNIKPKDKVLIPCLEYPQSEIFIYGVWNMGAVGVLPGQFSEKQVRKKIKVKSVSNSDLDLFKEIEEYSVIFNPKHKPLLRDEAVITFEKSESLRLSHYNILVNTNGLQKAIHLKSRLKFYCDLPPISSSWVVFQTILPIYSGCIFTKNSPDLTIGLSKTNYTLRYDLKNIKNYSEFDIGICPENSAVLSVGKTPIHLSHYMLDENQITIQGHSVMMGYLDDKENQLRFNENGLTIPV